MDFSKYVEWIKLPPRYLLPVFLFTGFVLFAPSEWLSIFGLADLVDNYRHVFGFTCLLTAALLLSSGVVDIYNVAKERRKRSRQLKHLYQSLHKLSEPEKELLRLFIHNETTTEYFSMTNGVVGGLVAKSLLYRSSKVGDVYEWAYNIQPWAWKYLNSHQKLLE